MLLRCSLCLPQLLLLLLLPRLLLPPPHLRQFLSYAASFVLCHSFSVVCVVRAENGSTRFLSSCDSSCVWSGRTEQRSSSHCSLLCLRLLCCQRLRSTCTLPLLLSDNSLSLVVVVVVDAARVIVAVFLLLALLFPFISFVHFLTRCSQGRSRRFPLHPSDR